MKEEARSCGPCTLCCKVMAVDDIDKPAGVWCGHCGKAGGCAIYEIRPQPCRSFSCAWLRHPELPHSLRPDRTRVVLAFDNEATRLIATCDPAHPLAWKQEPMFTHLKGWAERAWPGGQVVIAAGPRLWLMAPTGEVIDLGELQPNARFTLERRLDGSFEAKVTASP